MESAKFTESVVENSSLVWLEGFGYSILLDLEIFAGELATDWRSFSKNVLNGAAF